MGREREGKTGERREGEGTGREGTAPPNILLHPQFQFSRNMPGWHLPEPCWATQTLRGRPCGLLQLTIGFLPPYVSIIRRRASCAGTPGSRRATWPNRDKRRWRIRCHQWLTNQIAEAPLHWRHEPTSIHQVSVADTSCGNWKASNVFMSATKSVYVSVP